MNRENALVIICTRLESSRLPRKALLKIAGMPALDHILERLKPTEITTILAVPTNEAGQFEQLYGAQVKNWPKVYLFAGNAGSPLHRMAEAVQWYERSTGKLPLYVVRVTHDDILIDAETVLMLLDKAESEKSGYAITPSIIEGAGVEVIHTSNLLAAAREHSGDVEHVSYFVRGPNAPVSSVGLYSPRPSIARPFRLTLDYPADRIVLEVVLRRLGPLASNDQICAYLDQNPHLLNHNRLPRLSFYTCAYNAEKWIAQTIGSVLNNGFDDFEYLILDDRSTDGTLGEVMRTRDPRVVLMMNGENAGLAASCNKAISSARGRYLMRVDADDLLIPGRVGAMMAELERTNAGIIYGGYREIGEDGAWLSGPVDPRAHHHAGCALMDSRFINEIRFRDGLRHWEGLEFYRRISERFRISYFDEPCWLYRQHPSSLSKSTPEGRAQIKKEIEGE